MDHPDDPVNISFARAGMVQNEPEDIISLVVSNEEDNPVGLLEKWSGDAWIYASTDILVDLN